jgi:hypothetical protein
MLIKSVEIDEASIVDGNLIESQEVTLVLRGSFLPKFNKLIGEQIYMVPMDAVMAMSEDALEEMRRVIEEYNHVRREG